MVYKRYIKRNGKVFGPYYYKSYRNDKGVIKTGYVSDYSESDSSSFNFFKDSAKKSVFILGSIIIALLLITFVFSAILQQNYSFDKDISKNRQNFNFLTGFILKDYLVDYVLVDSGQGSGSTSGTFWIAETYNATGDIGGCIPNCIGRVCGSDGCSGTCGNCSGGKTCLGGQCTAEYKDYCLNQKFECGTHFVESNSIYCGTCSFGQICSNGTCTHLNCTSNNQCRDNNGCTDEVCFEGNCLKKFNTVFCDDKNPKTEADRCFNGLCKGKQIECGDGYVWDYGTETCKQGLPPEFVPKDLILLNENCTSNFTCGEWSECNSRYNIAQIIKSNPLQGVIFRICIDLNNCKSFFTEEKECTLKSEVVVKKEDWCEKEYINLIDETGRVTSRMDFMEGNDSSLKINIHLGGRWYCSYCFDGIKNYDETGVDCGGSCLGCNEQELPLVKNSFYKKFIDYFNFFDNN